MAHIYSVGQMYYVANWCNNSLNIIYVTRTSSVHVEGFKWKDEVLIDDSELVVLIVSLLTFTKKRGEKRHSITLTLTLSPWFFPAPEPRRAHLGYCIAHPTRLSGFPSPLNLDHGVMPLFMLEPFRKKDAVGI